MLTEEIFKVKEADRNTRWEITVKKHLRKERELKTDDVKSLNFEAWFKLKHEVAFLLSILKSNRIKNKTIIRRKGANIINKI